MSSSTAAPTSRAASDNIGPLETRFTPPPACSSVFSATLADDYEGAINLLYGGQCEGNSAVFDSARCMPPGTVPSIATTSGNFGFMAPGYYSPSLFCPHGYSTACSGYGGKGSTFPFSPAEVETAIGCCPTGYVCGFVGNQVQVCFSVGYTSSVVAVTCNSGTASPFTANTPLTELGSASMTSVYGYAPFVQLLRQDGDLSVLFNDPTTSSTITSSSSASSSSFSLTVSSTSSSHTSQTTMGITLISMSPSVPSTKHISNGAVAGITISVLAGAAAFFSAVVYVFRTRRRAAANSASRRSAELGGYDLSQMIPSYTPVPSVDYFEKTQGSPVVASHGPYEMAISQSAQLLR